MRIFLIILLLACFHQAYAQNQKPCTVPEASQFDFWVGEWDASWGDTSKGSNRIEKLYGNCTVHENFSDPQSNFLGQSWSVYNANYKKWQQTWIDNAGGYIHLTGGKAGDSMILTTEERVVPVKLSATGKLRNRMVYYNITGNSFDWSWESSTDGGLTWKSNWLIHYKRKKN